MVKVISLSDEAYTRLSMIKNNMSFSETILNLMESRRKRDIKDFLGVWSESEGKKVKKAISDNRKKQKMAGAKF